MGKTTTVEKTKKKKGRPSLLDLQKRNLLLQNQNPIPNPSVAAATATPPRRSTRRTANPETPEASKEDDEEDEEGESSGKRKEKKLKLVLRLPPNGGNRSSGPDPSGSESDGESRGRKRKVGDIVGDGSDRDKMERRNSLSKTTHPPPEDPSVSGPTTPLPDRKLLVFILDRLQKKDTRGVFAEPVDPIELPDYHEIIEHPMDFSAIKKKLSSGAYASLEQFEKDVFLISSNAMRYNSPDTIYFRQARSIQELAKKNFVDLRQQGDNNEPEQKVVRRGRPPGKSSIKKPVGRPSAERTVSDFPSNATLANAADNALGSNSLNDLLRKGLASDKASITDLSTWASQGFRNSENISWLSDHKSNRNEEFSGSILKGSWTKYGKKVSVSEENRRNTYKQLHIPGHGSEASTLVIFEGEKKQLVPVGLHIEHSYTRSLARFAANLGPVGWKIAAKLIERALPPGTKFGRGWVGEKDEPSLPQLSKSSTASTAQPTISAYSMPSKADIIPERLEQQSDISKMDEGQPRIVHPPSASSAVSDKACSPREVAEGPRASNYGSGIGGVQQKNPLQLQQNSALCPTVNGFSVSTGFNLSHVEKIARSALPTGGLHPQVHMTHAQVLNMVSRGDNSVDHSAATGPLEAERTKLDNTSTVNSGSNFMHPTAAGHFVPERTKLGYQNTLNSSNSFIHPKEMSWSEVERAKLENRSTMSSGSPLWETSQIQHRSWQGSTLHQKPDSAPPDLNVRFQSPGSPVPVMMVDSQQPDLALQL